MSTLSISRSLCGVIVLALLPSLLPAVNMVTVDAAKVKCAASPTLWGIFFEDIDLSMDGGVYAELIRNRSFEDGAGNSKDGLAFWSGLGKPGTSELSLDTTLPLSAKNSHALKVVARPGGGVANAGYFGISSRAGAEYRLSLAVRGDVEGPLEVGFDYHARKGAAAIAAQIGNITTNWQTRTLTFRAPFDYPNAEFVIRAPKGGTFYLDCVSLFPSETYGTSGLFRKDLMTKLAGLRPAFVRFPGGCWVEGDTMDKAYRWKKTIGSVWERPTQWNIWGYWATHGVGFHEYLLLCEELHAEPLFCINVGMSHKENVPLDKMGEFVQDALDAVEYANGPVTSKWGAVRAAAGHPAPFNLKYIEIGNENWGKAYEERYPLLHDALRARYPEVRLIANNFHGTIITNRPVDLQDEHYYTDPDWMMGEGSHKYDNASRAPGDRHVFVGEYAVTRDVGPWGSLRAAIGEAAFMVGMERNSDVVELAAYAPLFANVNHLHWTPNLISVSSDGCVVNPSYDVQRLFAENAGAKILACEVAAPFAADVRKGKDGRPIAALAADAVETADGKEIIVKVVNVSGAPVAGTVTVKNAKPAMTARKIAFTGPAAGAANSFTEPARCGVTESMAAVKDGVVTETFAPFSLTILRFGR